MLIPMYVKVCLFGYEFSIFPFQMFACLISSNLLMFYSFCELIRACLYCVFFDVSVMFLVVINRYIHRTIVSVAHTKAEKFVCMVECANIRLYCFELKYLLMTDSPSAL